MAKKIIKPPFELPFSIKISFKTMLDRWRKKAESSGVESAKAKLLLSKIEKIKPLNSSFNDLTLLDKYKDEIAEILDPLFPQALQLNEIKSAVIPFQPVFFNTTKRFQGILDKAGKGFDMTFKGIEADNMYVAASSFILSMKYGLRPAAKKPFLFEIPDHSINVNRYYRAFINGDFMSIKPKREIDLSDDDLNKLLENPKDIELWKKHIPPNSFEMEGFGLMTILDVSIEEALSSIKQRLIGKVAIKDQSNIQKIEKNLRTIFNTEDIKLSISAIRGEVLISPENTDWEELGSHEMIKTQMSDTFCVNSRSSLSKKDKIMTVADVSRVPENVSKYVEKHRASGIKSFMLTSLYDGEELIGILELMSKHKNALNGLGEDMLNEISPLFALALSRTLEDYENKMEAIVQEKWTAIHPSVSWRFRNAAEKYLLAVDSGDVGEIDDIVFDNVSPIFGQLDIKGSSTSRNNSIKADLIAQLKLAEKVLNSLVQEQPLYIYENILFKIREFLHDMKNSLNSGDEITILHFLSQEVEPIFNFIYEDEPSKQRIIAKYNNQLDPNLGILYKERKKHEHTVTRINEILGAYFDRAQEKAQKMFPHYYEAYRTDGIEYNIYLGQSLVANKKYHKLYLKNIRLWQLLTTWGAENALQQAKKTEEISLDVAALILAQNQTLDIKFRMEERRFDVDGAYNVRYEIIKKRIDKAHIKNSNERITSPGKLVVVFATDEEKAEYLQYFKFLVNKKLISSEIEDLELEELQGASGLKALRAKWLFPPEDSASKAIEGLMKEIIEN